MSFEWFVCQRYLRAKRKQKFISLIALISVLGVGVGVLALIVVLSVYTGFTEGLRDQIIGINAHITVQSYSGTITDPDSLKEQIESHESVIASMPTIYGQALISSGSYSSGIVLRGIDPASAEKVTNIHREMRVGKLSDLTGTDGVAKIVIGVQLARQLRVDLGKRVKLISPNGPLTPMGVIPRIRTCLIVGVFETGMYEYDSTLAYVDLKTARSLSGIDSGVHGFEVKVRDVDHADKTAAELKKIIGPGYSARDWMRLNENLFAALKLEKAGIFIALDLIIMVAALNIISALVMVVMEKTRDIAILKAMGAKTGQIMRVFFFQGAIIGLTGTVLGVLGGLGLCEILSRYKFIELPSNVYPMSTMPVKVVPFDVILVAISAVIITLLATIYPSWKASRVRPAESLTYE